MPLLASNSSLTDPLGFFTPLYFALLAICIVVLIILGFTILSVRRAQNLARRDPKEDRQRRELLVMNHLRDRGRRSFKQILRSTGMTPAQLVVALDYLEGRNLVTQDASIWKPSWMDNRVYEITAMGIDEVDNGRGHPLKNTAHLGPQILVTGGTVGDINYQGGLGNIQVTGDNSTALGGVGNVQNSPGTTLNRSAALDFTDEFRKFLKEFGGDDPAKEAAQRRLELIESSIKSDTDVEEIRTLGERALKLADGIAVSVAGRVSYEALKTVWDRVIS